MSYEILRVPNGLSIVHITEPSANSFEGWRIEFPDGQEAIIYNHRGEWVQYEEPRLDTTTLIAVGNCLDNSLMKRTPGTIDHFFYDMLVN